MAEALVTGPQPPASRAGPDDPPPTLAHRAEYAALRAVFGLLGALPRAAATGVGDWLGALGYRPLGIRRNVVERQIAASFPALEHHDVERIARAAYQHLGRISIEIALLRHRGRDGVLELFEGADGWEHVERGLALGRGLIMATGHVGNWELGGAYIAARGVPFDAIVRRQGNLLFDRYLNDTRTRIGMRVVRDDEAVRRVTRSLKEGRAVAFVSDQGVKGIASTFVPFFGRPAKTPRGPAVFALRLGAPVVFAAAIRQPSGLYRMRVEPVPVEETGDRDRDVDVVVAAYTRILEQFVRRDPEQYFWHHRRWRRQPKGTPPELSEPR